MPSNAPSTLQSSGFSLVELVAVILIVAILSAFAIPRFVSDNTAALRTSQDIIISTARHAQQLAMNRGSGNTVSLETDNTSKKVLIKIGASVHRSHDLSNDVAITAIAISYTVLGETTTTTINISGGSTSRCVQIESTGYAHAC